MNTRITLTEAAYMCGVSEITIRRWMEKGFPERNADGTFSEREVLEWAAIRAIRTAKILRS